ncbi:MAG: tetratricopeptide repeat protein [Phenylobacterium sp.]|uniref:winged helix-turn-helix domain-containing tetratricopeptide repeat protein n=1 Tax=Phenylobacterium sp. TaxID=1871053 RepID=UPI0011FB1B6B|nr:tetratricopeptide repeat protein [Phenylobacterium sp.]TAJ68479.1 MAG: tetratricopeptide repeat protein [Phenylobacterium sp.]
MQLAHQPAFSLGTLEVRPPTCEVVSPLGREILQPRVMQTLVALAQAGGAVVSRDDLIATCWDGRVVGEDAITLVMMKLRRLADRSGGAFAVETIPRVGYRLATPTRDAAPAAKSGARSAGNARPRLVVLEFTHAPGDEEQAWFAEALADELTAGLAKSPLLSLTPRQALLHSDVAGHPPGAICARLGVDYVLDGKVRSLGGTVRVSVDLIQGSDETSAWSARYDRPMADLFAMLGEITTSIIGTVEPAVLEREEARALSAPEHSLQFWRLLVQGRRHFWRSTAEDVRKAETLLEQALEIEPRDVSALAILAHCKLFDVWVGTSADPSGAVAEAHRIALRAVSAGGADAFAHYTLGVVLSMMGRLTEARAEQRRALELNPYLAAASGEMGRLLAFDGQPEEAIAYSERAIAASPNDPHTWLWFRSKAIARFVAGDFEGAARDAADACARGPERFPLHYLLAACYAAGGRQAEAQRALEDGERLARDRAGPGRSNATAYSLEALKIGHPFVRPADLDRLVKALQKSGWQGA